MVSGTHIIAAADTGRRRAKRAAVGWGYGPGGSNTLGLAPLPTQPWPFSFLVHMKCVGLTVLVSMVNVQVSWRASWGVFSSTRPRGYRRSTT